MTADSDGLLRLVARLYHIDGLDQKAISELVGVSRPQVSRILTKARDRGIVRISVDEYDPRNRELEQALKERFSLNHAIVVRTVGDATPDTVRRNIGYFAAPYVSELTQSNTIFGLAGGRTVSEVVRHMHPTTGTRGLTAVQLMGNVGPNVTDVDAIELSRLLAQTFGGTFYTVNAPAFAPDASTRDQFLAHEHVRQVWQLFGMMEIALVGIGTLSDSVFIYRNAMSAAGLKQLEAAGAVGEICGRFFDANGQECVSEYRQRVISVDLDVLRRRPEVIAVTNGPDRAGAICAALRGCLVKSLIIDEAGALAVLDRTHAG